MTLYTLLWILCLLSLTSWATIFWFCNMNPQLVSVTAHHHLCRPFLGRSSENYHVDVLRRRAAVASEVCRAHNISKMSMTELAQVLRVPQSVKSMEGRFMTWLITDDASRVLYCVVPKTGSTNVRRVLSEMKRRRTNTTQSFNWTRINGRDTWYYKFDHISSKSNDQIEKILRTHPYTKILTVRHPFERIVSLYRMIFEGHRFENKTYSLLKTSANVIKEKIKKKYNIQNLKLEDVSFSHFVQYIIDHDKCLKEEKCTTDWFASHWTSIWRMCRVCSIDYDIVIRLETFDKDIKYLLERANFSNTQHYPDHFKRTSKSQMEKYSQMLSNNQRDGIYEVYEMDFKLFGYNRYNSEIFD